MRFLSTLGATLTTPSLALFWRTRGCCSNSSPSLSVGRVGLVRSECQARRHHIAWARHACAGKRRRRRVGRRLRVRGLDRWPRLAAACPQGRRCYRLWPSAKLTSRVHARLARRDKRLLSAASRSCAGRSGSSATSTQISSSKRLALHGTPTSSRRHRSRRRRGHRRA